MFKIVLKKLSRFLFLTSLVVFIYAKKSNAYYQAFYPARNDNSEIVLITGDSYAGYFAAYECLQDYGILIYADAGKSTKENFEMMKEAVNTFPDTVIISIGVNDHNQNVSPEEFKNRIEELVHISEIQNKRIILHTYMNYDLSCIGDPQKMYNVIEYDRALKDIAEKHKSTFYIDMSDYNNDAYLQSDRIHYNKTFYDALYSRVATALFLF